MYYVGMGNLMVVALVSHFNSNLNSIFNLKLHLYPLINFIKFILSQD